MHGEYKVPGGKLVVADVEVRDGRLADVRISGDFFPPEALEAINRGLDRHARRRRRAGAGAGGAVGPCPPTPRCSASRPRPWP